MKYACIVAFTAILGIAIASPTAAQDRGRSDGEVVVRDRGNGRGETGNGRGRTDVDVERGRRGSDGVERRSSGRTVEDILEGRNKDGNDRRRDNDDWDDRRRDDDDWDDRRRGDDDWDDDDWDDRRHRRNRGNGPAFCRSGEGHPVFGREWCRDKGFGLGGYGDDDWERRRRRGYDDWERRRIEDIFFPSRRNSRYMGGSLLENILGRVVYSSLGSHARSLRADGPIRGRWNGDSELRIYAGDLPFARFVDLNNDRRADVVYIRK